MELYRTAVYIYKIGYGEMEVKKEVLLTSTPYFILPFLKPDKSCGLQNQMYCSLPH